MHAAPIRKPHGKRHLSITYSAYNLKAETSQLYHHHFIFQKPQKILAQITKHTQNRWAGFCYCQLRREPIKRALIAHNIFQVFIGCSSGKPTTGTPLSRDKLETKKEPTTHTITGECMPSLPQCSWWNKAAPTSTHQLSAVHTRWFQEMHNARWLSPLLCLLTPFPWQMKDGSKRDPIVSLVSMYFSQQGFTYTLIKT